VRRNTKFIKKLKDYDRLYEFDEDNITKVIDEDIMIKTSTREEDKITRTRRGREIKKVIRYGYD